VQGQLDELRSSLRPLDETLQEILYLAAVRESDDGRVVNVNQLFGTL
jgi:hypothetical protein